MPRACILTTASKASLTGGAFADTLAANTGDVLGVQNFTQGQARIIEWWGIDSASVAELAMFSSRFHDPTFGIRAAIPSLVPGGAAKPAAHDLLPGLLAQRVYSGDTITVKASGTAADGVVTSFITEYDDLPNLTTPFYDWPTVQNLIVNLVGINVAAVASGTLGAYGAARAINADDDRLKADTYYAILGTTMRVPVTTVSLIGPDWANQRIGLPGGVAGEFNPASFFVDISQKWGKPMIPVIAANNKTTTTIQIADDVASTSPQLDLILAELSQHP